MEYTIFTQQNAALIVHSSFLLPIGWLLTMFVIQILHWGYAWIDDGKPHVNVMMAWTMVHIFQYDVDHDDRECLFSCRDDDGFKLRSQGALAIFVVPCCLALFPLALASLLEFYVLVGMIGVAVASLYGLRQLVRLSKIVRRHISNMEIHNKENI